MNEKSAPSDKAMDRQSKMSTKKAGTAAATEKYFPIKLVIPPNRSRFIFFKDQYK